MLNNQLVNAILAAFERDKDINLHHSPISVRGDDVICLEGEVTDIVMKRKAVRIAKDTARTQSIDDRLRLRVGHQRNNKELLNATVTALMQEPAFSDMEIRENSSQPPSHDRGWIDVSVEDTVVKLMGEVLSLSHRRLAEVIAWWVPGSCDVKNFLHVHPAETETDDEISDVVRMVFDKEISLDAEQISIITRNHEVTLRGVVFSDEQKRIASYDCWYIPGVRAVHNELVVMPR